MNTLTLVSRGLRFYRRTHLGVLAGCAVSAAVLVGALFVGDSVRGSLERGALARLGRVHTALDTGSRYFRDDLPARLGIGASAALRVGGIAIRGERKADRVEVLGIDAGFLGFAESPSGVAPARGQVAVNEKLAAALGAKVGEDVSLRVPKPGLLSRDAPLASREKRETERRPFTVVAILSDAQFGRFSLKSDQAGPHNALVNLAELQEILGLERAANLIVSGAPSADAAQAALRSAWTMGDAGLALRTIESRGVVQLQSPRIYLDPAAAAAAQDAVPDSAGALSYLVNSITAESGKKTPYSFMTAVSPGDDRRLGPVPRDMKDDEILVNRWLADHLAVKEGDKVTVAYSEHVAGNDFVKKSRAFRVRAVLSMEALAGERDLVPDFPGLTDVDTCKNWKIGLPMDEAELKDEANEAYWKAHKQTPKALVTLAAGRAMWANAFGDLMAIRFPAGATDEARLWAAVKGRLDPAAAGLLFRPVREQALRAAAESMDLGQLFLGMSLFLIAASLLLTAMLFVFTVEQRAGEMGVLRAVGFPPGRVRRLFLGEGLAIAVAGSLAGIPLGWGFARGLIWGLGTAWSGAVASAPISFHATAGSAAIGVAAGAAMSLVAMGAALWRQARRPVRELVAEDVSVAVEPRARAWRWVAGIAAAGGAATALGTLASGARNPAGNFFAAGSLMLVAGVAFVRARLARMSASSSARITLAGLGVRNAARRPGRGMATAAMLASGCFVVFSVSAMKEDLSRHGGTGGFEFYGESSLPVHHDLNDPKGREALRLTDAEALRGVWVVPIRVRDGDDASCLNLNLSLSPPLLGVDPGVLARRGAFGDVGLWKLLEGERADGIVPALVGDSATALWKLKKKAGKEGDLLDYRDERGRAFQVRLVGELPHRLSVLQGRLLVSERDFQRLYPSEAGHRTFLVDVPAGGEERARAHLAERLEDVGLALVPSAERLREFYVVESTYLMMFVVLGGLGLLLGSAGMGVLVVRNVMERRGELALLRAVGYSPAHAAAVVMAEHRFLLGAGLAVGTAAALVAIGPSVARPEASVPYGLLAVFLAGTAALGLGWIRLAAGWALRTPLVPALRRE